MKNRCRVLCILMASVTLLTMTGCGSSKEISNFYEQSNKAWMKEHKLSDSEVIHDYMDEKVKLVHERAAGILEEAQGQEGTDQSLQKVSDFYQQLTDAKQREEMGNAKIRELMDRIDTVQNLSDLYELMQDDEMAMFNPLLERDYLIGKDKRFKVYFDLLSLYGIHDKTPKQYEILRDGITEEMLILGYTKEQAQRIAENVTDVDEFIDTYIDRNKIIQGYDAKGKSAELGDFPFYEVMDKEGLNAELLHESRYIFFAREDYLSWLKLMVKNDNLEQIKDYYRIGVLEKLVYTGSDELQRKHQATRLLMGGATKGVEGSMTREELVDSLLQYDHGVLAHSYAEQYISDKVLEEAARTYQALQKVEINRIKNIDWFGTRLQEKESNKIKLAKVHYGAYEEYNELGDVTVGDCATTTAMSLLRSDMDYNRRFLQEGMFLSTKYDLLSAGTWYDQTSNAVLIGAANLICEEEESREQYMGSHGMKLARELAHAMDYRNFSLEAGGVDMDFVDQDHFDRYLKTGNAVYGKVHEKYTGSKNVTDGSKAANDGIAEQLAMENCLQILEEEGACDYQQFFDTYGRENAQVIRNEEEKLRMINGEPLRPRVKVNYVVGQLDTFYDTYSVKRLSAYYVTKEKRVVLFY